jgi:hypothetical protein
VDASGNVLATAPVDLRVSVADIAPKATTTFTSGFNVDARSPVLLPASFDKVCRFAETHGLTLDHACRRIIGLDTHTAGRRLGALALPHSLGDVL